MGRKTNIGVVDTLTPLPFTIDIDSQNIILERGQTAEVLLQFNIPNVLLGEGEVSASLNKIINCYSFRSYYHI